MTIKELKEHLQGYDDNLFCAWALCLPSDVKAIAGEEEVELSDEEIGEILNDVNSNQDSEYGITWESIRCAVQDFVRDRQKESSLTYNGR